MPPESTRSDGGCPVTVNQIVTTVVSLAVVFTAVLLLSPATAMSPSRITENPPLWVFLAVAGATALSDIVYVPVRRGDAWEELTFYEIMIVVAVLVLPMREAFGALVAGLFLAEMVATRTLVKKVFNVGLSIAGICLTMFVYTLFAGNAEPFTLHAITAITVATLTYSLVELGTLALVLWSTEGTRPREYVKEQVGVSVIMGIWSVGTVLVAVSLLLHTPLLVPFAGLPVVALWYAYRVNSANVEAKIRSQWMIELGKAVSTLEPVGVLLPDAASSLRKVYGAENWAVVLNGGARYGEDSGWVPPAVEAGSSVALEAGMLPEGWKAGIAVRLDGVHGEGVVALGVSSKEAVGNILPWSRSWGVPATEIPALVALASAISNAVKASQRLFDLNTEKSKLQAVVDHVTDGICVIDDHSTVLLWSPAAANMTGVSDPNTASPSVISLITGTPADGTKHLVEFDRVDGQRITLHVIAVRMKESKSTVVTIRDMTRERKADRLKADFISTISHELRTPITPIRGYANLLKTRWEKLDEAKRSRMLETIEERAEHLSRLVDDLLVVSKLESGGAVTIASEDCNLVAVVNTACDTFPALDGRIHAETREPIMVHADPSRVTQILSNLLGNAEKYTPANSPITIEYTITSNTVMVHVRDAGAGMPAHELEPIFDRFYRIEDPLTMTTSGNGLGLHISRQLAHAMGGSLTVTSTLGEGSTFTLALPRLPTPDVT